MDLEKIKQLLDFERRCGALDDGVIELLPLITRARSVDGSRHTVLFSSLTSDNADQAIAEQVEYFRGQQGEVEWKAYGHDTPADILARLARHDFDVGQLEAVLVLDLRVPAAWILDPPAQQVIRVETLEQIQTFGGVADEVFGSDCSATTNDLARAIRAGSTDHVGYIAFDGGTPAAVGRLYTRAKSVFGGLYGGGTLPEHRKRGLYRALVAARAKDAAERGAEFLIVDALPTSRPILESLGFVHLTDTWPCILRRTE